MSAPISPDEGAVGPPERLHPLFLIKGLRRSLRSLGGAYALIAYLAVSGRWSTAVVAAIAILLLGIGGTILYWTRFQFRVGQHEIRIDSGVVNRRHRSIPFDRIQDVDIVQGPLARLLDLAEVKFETGGGGEGPRSEEGVLHAITLDRAEEIRRLVRGRRVSALEPARTTGERPPIYAMSAGRVFLAGTFNFSLAVFAALIGFTQTIGQPLGIDPFQESFWRNLVAASTPLEQFVLTHRLAGIAAGIALLLLLGLGTGIVRTLLRDYGFRLDGTGTGLRRRRGLLTRTDVTLPVNRAQAVIVASGPVRESFGWSELFLQSLAQEERSRGNHELAPLAQPAEVDAILEEMRWRPVPASPAWTRVSPAYVGSFALALSPFLLVIVAQALVVWPMAVLFSAGLLALVAGRALAWRRIAYALDGDRLLMRSGWWRRRLVILPKSRIQSIDYTENFITRRLGTATLQFGVAGGRAAAHLIPAIPTGAARALRDGLLGSAP
ncbi:MAG TPA: PH domain-containing protein [Sphingomicrobium sp.]|nr:PH domain-containing protein [Sphingomicrobium sp.]